MPSGPSAVARNVRSLAPSETSAAPPPSTVMSMVLVRMLTVTRQVCSMPLWEVTVMVAVPSLTPVTTPVSDTVAMPSSLLSQVKSVALW